MWSDPVADMLTRIRNAVRNQADEVKMPRSKLKAAICQVLKDEGYINGFDEVEDGNQGVLRVQLRYGPRGEQILHSLKRESKAGRRLFVGVDGIPKVLNGLGIAILSTSKGVMSDRKCRELRVGGELICTVD